MRLLTLIWPHLAVRLALGRDPDQNEPVVLGGRPWDPGSVLDRSPAAGALGVRRGQALGTAHSLVPEATFLPFDAEAVAEPVAAALDALADLAPAVEGATDATHPAFGRVLIGIEGLARLWGDEPTLVGRATERVAPILPGAPRTGIGNTRFGSEVAARVGADAIPLGGRKEEAAFLAPLPLALLPAEAEVLERLRVLGLTSIGELAALDRSAVIARFGAPGGELHDLARGMDGRPLRPRRPVERLAAEVELDPPADTLEPLRFVLHHLCGTLCEQLSARGAGAARAVLTIVPDAPPSGRGAAGGARPLRAGAAGAGRCPGPARASADGSPGGGAAGCTGRAARAGAVGRGTGGRPTADAVQPPVSTGGTAGVAADEPRHPLRGGPHPAGTAGRP